MFTKLLIFVLVRKCAAVIYQLNDSDYALMPPVFYMDDYEKCLDDSEGLYCTADLALVSDDPSPLLTMIQEYSAHTNTHYNHTLLRHGICITQTCKKFYEVLNGDLRSALEACANESFYNQYKLKARVSIGFDCSKCEKNKAIDYVDLTVGVICVTILIANIVASICDYCFEKGKDYGGLRFLYSFSIFRNWKNLVAAPAKCEEPRLQVLKGFHGIRVLTMCLVIFSHAFLTCFAFTINPEYVEDMYVTRPFHILLNGTLIMQTFLIISSFLLVYNWLIHSEKHEPSWKMLPKHFLMRWLRLTPPYAVVLALTATWFGRIASGPYWKKFVGNEMHDCRRDWWKNLLYINNYVDDSECMVQSWYLAADTQLYYMAVIVFLICRTVRARKMVLTLLFVVSVVVPTLHTYYQDLYGVLVVTPEFPFNIFMNNRTFNEVYKRGHTNLTGYVIGMAMGYFIYDWQKTGIDPKRFRKYRYLYWTLAPMGFFCCYAGSIYYRDTPSQPLLVNLLFAALLKPIFGIIIGAIIVGVIIQFEGLYRTVLEWRVWTLPSRLSFSAYLLHIAFVRNYAAMQTTTYRISILPFVLTPLSIVVISFIAAFFFWMLVEAPFGNLTREFFSKPEPIKDPKKIAKEPTKIKYAKLLDHQENYVAKSTNKNIVTKRKCILNKLL